MTGAWLIIDRTRSQQRHLPARRAERRTVEVEISAAVEPQALERLGKTLGQQVGERPLAPHAAAEAAVVEFTATALADQAQHMGGALRIMGRQPLLEQRCHLQRQAQHHVGRTLRAGRLGLAQQGLQFAVVDHRDHRRTQHPHRHARATQYPDCPQARLGRSRPGFEDALQFVVQGGQADHHRHQPLPGQLGQQVKVAQDQRALGDDGHRVPVAQQHLQGTSGQQLFTLDGLVGIGIGPQVDRRALVAGFGQLLLQQGGGIALGDQPGFEVQPRGHVPVGVAGPRITVDADMLGYTFHTLWLFKK